MLLSYPDGIAVFDSDLNLIFTNPAFKIVFGAAGGKQSASELFIKTPEILERLRNLVKDGVSYLNHEFPVKTATGKTEPHEISINAVDFGAKRTGACVIVRSGAGKKELDSELEKEEKISILSIMSAGLAHEIKNPLGGIRGMAQLIGKDNLDVRESCDLIVKETDRISGLVNDLLDLERARDISPKPINIHRAIDETLAFYSTVFEENGISYVRDYDPSLPKISADEDRLKQVFLNLVKNAVETMEGGEGGESGKGGGKLRVKTRIFLDLAAIPKKGSKNFISVEFIDTGIGMDAETERNLFTPFNTTKKKGTGLGLAVSLNIINAHGGALSLENNSGGPGVTARVILPR